MNWFDTLILIVVIVSFVSGYMSGLVMHIASLAALLFAGIFAGAFSSFVAPRLIALLGVSPHIVAPLSYIVAFLLIVVAILFVGKMLTSFLKALHLEIANKFSGGLFASLSSIVLISIVLNLLVQFDQNSIIIKEDVRENAHTYPLVIGVARLVIPYLRFDWIS